MKDDREPWPFHVETRTGVLLEASVIFRKRAVLNPRALDSHYGKPIPGET